MNKTRFLLIVSASAALAHPASAATLQTQILPAELLYIAILLTCGILCFSLTQSGSIAFWSNCLAFITSALAFGASLAFGTAREIIINNTAVLSTIAYTNIGVSVFCLGLLVFSLILLFFNSFRLWHESTEEVM